jgi:hypothetical protein
MIHTVAVSMIIFAGAIICHVFLHRGGLVRLALATYPVGWVFLFAGPFGMAYPVTGLSLYTISCAAYFLYFMSYLAQAESPSAKVLAIVRSSSPVSEAQILSRFTNDELIGMRMKRLMHAEWIAKRGHSIIATRRGVLIAGIIHRYRDVLGWDEGG